MNDHDPLDRDDHPLSERMERAVGGLRAPDVLSRATARGRRQRTRRRLAYGVGGLAAVTVLAVTAQAFAGDWSGRGQDATAPPVAADPAPASPTPSSSTTHATTTAPGNGASEDDPCGPSTNGWWSKPSAEIRSDLSDLLPTGVEVDITNDDAPGTWGGNLVTGDDPDFASLTLLPPPGTPGGTGTLEDRSEGGLCFGGTNAPLQEVKPCDQLAGHVACEEIRSEDGALVGVVTENVEQTVVDGQGQPTDKAYVLATVVGPEGGHVELYVAEGTRADRPSTVHDPNDVPALTVDQARAVVLDPVWTS